MWGAVWGPLGLYIDIVNHGLPSLHMKRGQV